MIEKSININFTPDNYEILKGPELTKTAEFCGVPDEDLDANFLYIRVRAVSAGEFWGANKNADYFPEEELRASKDTFLTAHVFKNHENKDVAKAIGDVLNAIYNDDMHCVELVIRISRSLAPEICKGFEDGFMTDVSMGCKVKFSECSICGNQAKVRSEFCPHVTNERNKVYPDGRKVYEINRSPNFHDISAVLNGAERIAKALEIHVPNAGLPSGEVISFAKAAQNAFESELEKVASEEPKSPEFDFGSIKKKASFDKRAFLTKLSEIEKTVTGHIIDVAEQKVKEDSEKFLNDNSQAIREGYRMYNEKPWDQKELLGISYDLPRVAEETGADLPSVFDQFLKETDSMGIELTPKEFKSILNPILGIGLSSVPTYRNRVSDIDTACDTVYSATNEIIGRGNPAPSIVDILSAAITPSKRSEMTSLPTIISISTKRRPMGPTEEGYLSRAVSGIIPPRDNFLTPKPFFGNFNNESHYISGKFLETPESFLADILYAFYQRLRMDNCMKKNRYLEKSAGMMKDIGKEMVVIPGVYAYSAFQRARMAEGEDVGSFNRFAAQSPLGLYAGTVIGRKGAKGLAKGIQNVGRGIDDAFVSAKNKFSANKNVAENLQKNASFKNLSDCVNMFSNETIDKSMESIYNNFKGLGIIKKASLAHITGHNDLSEELMRQGGISSEELSGFLSDFGKVATAIVLERIDQELEKSASLSAKQYTVSEIARSYQKNYSGKDDNDA